MVYPATQILQIMPRGLLSLEAVGASLIIVVMGVVAMVIPTHAAPGDLDTTFGSSGRVISPINNGNNGIYDIKLQGDGRIVAVGYDTNINGAAQSAFLATF